MKNRAERRCRRTPELPVCGATCDSNPLISSVKDKPLHVGRYATPLRDQLGTRNIEAPRASDIAACIRIATWLEIAWACDFGTAVAPVGECLRPIAALMRPIAELSQEVILFCLRHAYEGA